jgi:ceramide glucosyltransferase
LLTTHSLLHLLEALLSILALCGSGYYVLCTWSALRFLRRRQTVPGDFAPPISVLKPLRGVDPQIDAALRSHCQQDYPEYEIIFGVSDPDDPVVAEVERLREEFPAHPIKLVVCDRILGGNMKMSTLAQMLPFARYEHLLVNDSDIRVEPDYLRRVVAPLADPQIGLVTSLYRGVPAKTLPSRLEGLGISTDFCGGVLSAIELEGGLHFGLGSTLMFRRENLRQTGGFEALVNYLADDFQLGRKLSDLGLRGYLSEVVVETFLPAYSWREFFDHQLRWARSVRDSRGWGYLGVGLTFGVPWALALVALAPRAAWAWVVFAAVLLLRLLLAVTAGSVVAKDRRVLPWLWLVPVRDLFALVVWVAGYAGHTVLWRGQRFFLEDGRLIPISDKPH